MFKIRVQFDDADEPLEIEIGARDLVRLEQQDPLYVEERKQVRSDEDARTLFTATRMFILAHVALLRMQRKGLAKDIPDDLEDFIDSAEVEGMPDPEKKAAGEADPTVLAPNTGGS